MRALALLSGGLDSSVAAAMTARRRALRACIFFAYGQRAAAAERRAARWVVRRLGVALLEVRLPWLGRLKTNALTDARRPLPRLSTADLGRAALTRRTARAVWVPNRNGVFLNVAAAIAEARGWDTLVTGFNREEAATFPDNSVEFVRAATRAFRFSTANRIQVRSPTATWDKVRIAREARRLRLPLGRLWPCYRSGRRPCGWCESCRRFWRARRMAVCWDLLRRTCEASCRRPCGDCENCLRTLYAV